jgi:hypothetical protein
MALAVALYRSGKLTVGDIEGMSESLAQKAAAATGDEAERFETAAHLANCLILEAEIDGMETQWRADQARSRFRVIEGKTE